MILLFFQIYFLVITEIAHSDTDACKAPNKCCNSGCCGICSCSCGSDQYCVDGVCLDKKKGGVPCSDDVECRGSCLSNNQCSCSSVTSCFDSDKYCDGDTCREKKTGGEPCGSDAQCKSGKCVDRKCKCTTTAPCSGSDMICYINKCIALGSVKYQKPCTSNAHCKSLNCASAKCKCRSETDCSSGDEYCDQTGTCVAKKDQLKSCMSNKECDGVCFNRKCVSECSAAGVSCVKGGEDLDTCYKDKVCLGSERKMVGTICLYDNQCISLLCLDDDGERPKSGIRLCRIPCDDHTDCPSGICHNEKMCLSEFPDNTNCYMDSECKSGLCGKKNKCVARCKSTHSSDHDYCENTGLYSKTKKGSIQSCQDNGECEKTYRCIAKQCVLHVCVGRCDVEVGHSCTENKECRTKICRARRCRESCSSSSSTSTRCASDKGDCIEDACIGELKLYLACSSSGQCSTGACKDDICMETCENVADCSFVGSVCESKYCRGYLNVNHYCYHNAQCQSLRCVGNVCRSHCSTGTTFCTEHSLIGSGSVGDRCSTDDSCSTGHCDVGLCVKRCASDVDCPTLSSYCHLSKNACIAKKDFNESCSQDEQCKDGKCYIEKCLKSCSTGTCSGPRKNCVTWGSEKYCMGSEPNLAICTSDESDSCQSLRCDASTTVKICRAYCDDIVPCMYGTCSSSMCYGEITKHQECKHDVGCTSGLCRKKHHSIQSKFVCIERCTSSTGSEYCEESGLYPKKPNDDACHKDDQCKNGKCHHNRCTATASRNCPSEAGACVGELGIGYRCTSHSDCRSLVCEDGRCRKFCSGQPCIGSKALTETCRSDEECSIGKCYHDSCAETCTCDDVIKCPFPSTCNNDVNGVCTGPKIEFEFCNNHVQCESLRCVNRVCRSSCDPPCNNQTSCGNGKDCIGPIEDGVQCLRAQQCRSGFCDSTTKKCLKRCKDSSECGDQHYCNVTVNACYAKRVDLSSCEQDEQCTNRCLHQKCSATFGTVMESENCKDHTECKSLICDSILEICRSYCKDSSTCHNSKCDSVTHSCIGTVSNDKSCKSHSECLSGKCYQEKCRQACTSVANCNGKNMICNSKNVCLENKPDVDYCVKNEECSNQTCFNNICLRHCTTTSECEIAGFTKCFQPEKPGGPFKNGKLCVGEKKRRKRAAIGKTCTSSNECDELVCSDDICRKACFKTSECPLPAKQQCKSNGCHGKAKTGEACTEDMECEGQKCVESKCVRRCRINVEGDCGKPEHWDCDQTGEYCKELTPEEPSTLGYLIGIIVLVILLLIAVILLIIIVITPEKITKKKPPPKEIHHYHAEPKKDAAMIAIGSGKKSKSSRTSIEVISKRKQNKPIIEDETKQTGTYIGIKNMQKRIESEDKTDDMKQFDVSFRNLVKIPNSVEESKPKVDPKLKEESKASEVPKPKMEAKTKEEPKPKEEVKPTKSTAVTTTKKSTISKEKVAAKKIESKQGLDANKEKKQDTSVAKEKTKSIKAVTSVTKKKSEQKKSKGTAKSKEKDLDKQQKERKKPDVKVNQKQ